MDFTWNVVVHFPINHLSADECWLCSCIGQFSVVRSGTNMNNEQYARIIIALADKSYSKTYRDHCQRHQHPWQYHQQSPMTIRCHCNLHWSRHCIRDHFDVLSMKTRTTMTHSLKSFVFSSIFVRLHCSNPSLVQFHFQRTYANSNRQQMLLVDWSTFSLVDFWNEHTKYWLKLSWRHTIEFVGAHTIADDEQNTKTDFTNEHNEYEQTNEQSVQK